MADETLRVKLSAEGVAELVAALRAVGNQSVIQGQRAKRSFEGITSAAMGLRSVLAPLAAALSVGALIAFARRSAELADDLAEATEKMGGTATQVAGLALAFRLAGVSLETSSLLLGVMSKNLSDFEKRGGKASAALHQLGFEAGDFKGKSLTDSIILISRELAKLAPGFDKNALAATIFGRRALALLPALNKIGTEGMEQFIRRVDRMFSPEAITAAGDFADLLGRVGFEMQGLALNFVAGFAQPMTRAIGELESEIDTGLVQSIQKFGFEAGKVAAWLTLTFANLGDSFGTYLEVWKVRLQEIGELIQSVTSRSALDVGAIILRFEAQYAALREGVERRNADRAAERASILASTFSPTSPVKGGTGTATGAPRLDLLRAQADAELGITKARVSAEEAENERAFDSGLLSLQRYFARRLELAEAAHAAELAALRDKLAAVNDDDETKAEAERAKLRGEMEAKTIAFEERRAALLSQYFNANVKLHGEIEKAELAIDRSRAGAHARRMADIDKEVSDFSVKLAQLGVVGEEHARRVAALRSSLLAGEDFAVKFAEAQDAIQELDAERSAIESRMAAGLIGQRDGEQELLALERARLVALRAVAEAAHAAAVASKDPESIQKTTELLAKVNGLGVGLGEAQKAVVGFKDAAINSALDNIANSLALTGDAALRTAGFFREMARSILADIQRILTRMLVLQLATSIGILPKAAGGLVPGKRLASGGAVSGPGGSTADRVPALLSHGEFVVRSAVVRRPGVLEYLETLNAGMQTPALRGLLGTRRFAEGGLVSASGVSRAAGSAARVDGTIQIGIDDGLVVRALQTPKAQRVLIQILNANRQAVRQAVS
ncbi:MAG: hypothetical protein A2V88_02650 [Elusimicrobia bacterium RBG_16_66_12]|nr:MAG: hypothetical protein A2V88_02650 [Elusimicrobia bacterium RBG_16_66_12]